MAFDDDLIPVLKAITDRLTALEQTAPTSADTWASIQAAADYQVAFWANVQSLPDEAAYIAFLEAQTVLL